MRNKHNLIVGAALLILTIAVIVLSVSAIWKHHQDSVATVDTTRQAVQQRNDAVQALANEQAVNESLRSSVTTVTNDKKAVSDKLAALCAIPANKPQAACK